MTLTNLITTLLLPLVVVAYNPFKGVPRAVLAIEEQVTLSSFNQEFDPTALLASRPRNSEIYTKAMIELKRLESEQTCHRLSAQLLMNNCKGAENLSAKESSQLSNAQNHHVESFANGLTLCDLSRGKFAVSDACAPFTSLALLRVYQGEKGKLEITPMQTAACIEALAKDHSQWLTWLKHRDNALMFCRAVRLDIDKDETITLHKELTRLMAEFAQGLELDLEHAKQAMAAHAREAEKSFEETLSQAGQLRANMRSTMEVFSQEAQDVYYSVTNAKISTIDLQRMVKVLIETVMQSNADMAAGQEEALVATTELANSRMIDINAMAEGTIANLHGLRIVVMDQLLPAVISINERQDAIEQKSDQLNAALDHMTYMVNNQTESLDEARSSVQNIIKTLEKTAAIAKSWTEIVSISSTASDWALRVTMPPFGLMLGSYGLLPSMARNIGLFLSGLVLAETVVWMRHFRWDWIEFPDDSETPSAITREKVGCLATTPLEIDIELA